MDKSKRLSYLVKHCSLLCLLILIVTTTSFAKEDEVQFQSVEERRLHSSIQQELDNIDNQKKVLVMREKELKTLEDGVDKKIVEVDKKLQELQDLKKKIEVLLTQKSAEEMKKIKNLGKIYEKMNPEKAAFAMSGLDEHLATELLANMKVKSAAKILDQLNKQKTTQLSTTFSQIQLE